MFEDSMLHGTWPASRRRVAPPLLPHVIAASVREEAGAWLGEELPRDWIAVLAGRAEAVCAHNARVRRILGSRGNRGRDWLWAFTRHWLCALLLKHRPDLHAQLPSSYNTGHPLPDQQWSDRFPRINRKS